jgi:hypothetical protein
VAGKYQELLVDPNDGLNSKGHPMWHLPFEVVDLLLLRCLN